MDFDLPDSVPGEDQASATDSLPLSWFGRWSRRFAHALTALICCAFAGDGIGAGTNDIYMRFRVVEPVSQRLRITIGGKLHQGPEWGLPRTRLEMPSGEWSNWVDLTRSPLHRRTDRSGGVAEWPTLTLTIATSRQRPIEGAVFDVQLADGPSEAQVVIAFTERAGTNAIGFLLPHPLREKKAEFETASAMTARHAAWAKEATGGRPIALNRFKVITSLFNHFDPTLAAQDVQTLKGLGFNVISGAAPAEALEEEGLQTLGKTWLYRPDPDEVKARWEKFVATSVANPRLSEDRRWKLDNAAQFVVADEVKALKFSDVDPQRRDGWFRDYLRDKGIGPEELGMPVASVTLPAAALAENRAPTSAALLQRRVFYHAAKFGQQWSAQQLLATSRLVKQTFPAVRTQTMPTSHGFFSASGPPQLGMSYALLDLFALGRTRSVDILAAEDWLGLNHMYGPRYTWTGAQSFEYLNALIRSGIRGTPMELQSLITPSDDQYLRLKAYSALAQGAKSFFFWTYGPTFVGTENYWSDLRSQYDGVAKFTKALQRAEPVLYPAQPVTDPVAILYSVSHDIWHPDDPAAFVETRLLWHALRHIGIQPDFLSEESVEAGALDRYKVLYVAGNALSRRASAAIDTWVRAGGIVQLSAGAATRDEFFEPYLPAFAAAVWPEGAALKLVKERHQYNERTDLPGITPLTRVRVTIGGATFGLPVLGYRLTLPGSRSAESVATFEDGGVAAASAPVGRGRVIGLGFLPMLAYGQLARFQQTTLAERWTPEPRALIELALKAARIDPHVSSNVPVVEASLLTGPAGSAVVLANYTYQRIPNLELRIDLDHSVASATSVEGHPVSVRSEGGKVVLRLPLEWTDIVLLGHN